MIAAGNSKVTLVDNPEERVGLLFVKQAFLRKISL